MAEMDVVKIIYKKRRYVVGLAAVVIFNVYLLLFFSRSGQSMTVRIKSILNGNATSEPPTVDPAQLYPAWVKTNLSRTSKWARIKPWNYDQNSAWTPLDGKRPRGMIWPLPRHQKITKNQLVALDVRKLSFKYRQGSVKCDVTDKAFERYTNLIRNEYAANMHDYSAKAQVVREVEVAINRPCEVKPHLNMNETYQFVSNMKFITISADTVWGILRGLESFSQLLWTTSRGQVVLYETKIVDYPRYKHRGILMDTARHFLPKELIMKNLDAMSYNKMNVLHWHLVDDQSFPFFSETFPELSYMGAYDAYKKIYTPQDVREIIDHARLRGIRIIPEFDTPGHTLAFGKSHPELLTPCSTSKDRQTFYGPMNPTLESTYEFMDKFYKEIRDVFDDEFIHLGGDEVDNLCWSSNYEIREWMEKRDYRFTEDLVDLYMSRLMRISKKRNFKSIVWHETFKNGLQGFTDTVVQVWDQITPENTLSQLTSNGYDVIISYPWYLDHVRYGESWKQMYGFEPTVFSGSDQMHGRVLGGEACMWGEYFDETNFLQGIWPRTSAVAERLWSSSSVNDVNAASARLYKHRCRMIKRGIPAHPTRTGVCSD